MSKILLPSLLFLFVFFAGCASSPKIVGKWKILPSAETENIQEAQIFPDGTVLLIGAEDDSHILADWSMNEQGNYVISAEGEETKAKALLPDRDVMIWKMQEDDGDVIVLHRISK
jgi:hypothetical protein